MFTLLAAFALSKTRHPSVHCRMSGSFLGPLQPAFEFWAGQQFRYLCQRVESFSGIFNVPARWHSTDRQLVSRLDFGR